MDLLLCKFESLHARFEELQYIPWETVNEPSNNSKEKKTPNTCNFLPTYPSYLMKMYEKTFKDSILPLKNKLYRLALRIVQDTAEAEDVVQETLIRIWEKREEWDEVESFDALGLTICRNLALDRMERKDAQTLELLPEEMDTAHTSDPFSQFVAQESYKVVERVMEELPVRQREIFQLRDMEGMSYREIAEILQVSDEQVKVYLFRARQHIKRRFEEIQNYGLHLH